MIFQSYDSKTGKINYTLQMSADNIDEIVEKFDEYLVVGDGDYRTHYVDIHVSPPMLREKTARAIEQDKQEIRADGEETMTLSNLPIPCTVRIGDDKYSVTDGVFEFGTLRAGMYSIEVESVPFLPWNGGVRAI